MVRALLARGLVAGAVAGLCAALFARLFAEPSIDAAIAFEAAKEAARGAGAAPEVVPRALQATVGLVLATSVYGAAVGGVVALVFAALWGRLLGGRPGHAALVLAGVAFVVVFLAPFAKYPANPPGVGDPETIGRRTVLFLVMIWISIACAVAAVRAARLVRQRTHGRLTAAGGHLLGVLLYLLLVGLAAAVLPTIRETPRDFPAQTLWSFRLGAIGTQAALWATFAVVFAEGVERVMAGRPLWLARSARRPVAASLGQAPGNQRSGGP
ncbi:CbtA family protein [Thermoleophilum album]|uniref:Probable cobalt transporter subunit (CbtA) n=1 Tax=Thermoleophilum album TaxID=29539 RepID=A0A1H6FR68_THEAL|nr:CbtA family protein [Thermoleophilum album]SEH12842.1 Probable cobalt transporter subunit (CbtA) [Thermoleophilum album]